jgi:hypothetical protein
MTGPFLLPEQPDPLPNSLLQQLQGQQFVPPRPKVFLSHATSDTEHVSLVKKQIEAMGITLYLAEHDPKAGTNLAQKVIDAIHRCQAVVVLITTASFNSAYVHQEVGIARESGKWVIPVIEKGVDTRNLGILQGVEHIELDLAQPAETMASITANLQPLMDN